MLICSKDFRVLLLTLCVMSVSMSIRDCHIVANMHFSHVSHILCYSFLETYIVHYVCCVCSVFCLL